jgi:hypothetical protein
LNQQLIMEGESAVLCRRICHILLAFGTPPHSVRPGGRWGVTFIHDRHMSHCGGRLNVPHSAVFHVTITGDASLGQVFGSTFIPMIPGVLYLGLSGLKAYKFRPLIDRCYLNSCRNQSTDKRLCM